MSAPTRRRPRLHHGEAAALMCLCALAALLLHAYVPAVVFALVAIATAILAVANAIEHRP